MEMDVRSAAKRNPATALVTGGAVRVGREISLALARHGYRVAVNYHRSATAAEQLVRDLTEEGLVAACLGADITEPGQAHDLVRRVETDLGPIELLVNNAAIFERRPFLQLDEKIWARHMHLNLEAPFRLSRLVVPGMLERGRGRIINICGTVGIRPFGEYIPYCVAKSGLDTVTRCLAAELAPHIQVNGVAPGAVLFPEGTSPRQRREILSRVPAGVQGDPRDVAAAVLFFAGAPEYVTGTILPVDGGASLGVG